ncbi:hypothetical protein JR316_0000346 [Psilocybe cubensis]|uniref:Uncharacterized protein n=2 Tax=Psilocybe cubensis TaxID=181762 RepID=A0ACB8HF50_PSICU|nr:hypothetical protein JR316_0000346 [Psilocybe cubensis]KAH9486282.1 hypothetical protein JR316_0000346 [Psilocybe cubensis]
MDLRPVGFPTLFLELSKLANTLKIRYDQRGDMRDLEEAMYLLRQALEFVPVPHPDRPQYLFYLAEALYSHIQPKRYEDFKEEDDVIADEMAALCREALELPPPPKFPLNRLRLFDILRAGLHARILRSGGLASSELDELISIYRERVKFGPPSSFMKLHIELAVFLFLRYDKRGELRDNDECLPICRRALGILDEANPMLHPILHHLISLFARSLLVQFKKEGDPNDLEEGISFSRKMIQIGLPPHVDQTEFLTGLAALLFARYKLTCNTSDFEESLSLYKRALDPDLNSSFISAIMLNNYADVLLARFAKHGHRKDLDQSISLYKRASNKSHPSEPSHSVSLRKLNDALGLRSVLDLDLAT